MVLFVLVVLLLFASNLTQRACCLLNRFVYVSIRFKTVNSLLACQLCNGDFICLLLDIGRILFVSDRFLSDCHTQNDIIIKSHVF